MCERGMGSAVGEEPKVLQEITAWAKEFSNVPVFVKLSPNVTDIRDPGMAAVMGGCDGISLINTIKSIIGVDLDTLVPKPSVGKESTNGGYCGPAVKPIALHLLAVLGKDPKINVPISGIGGISTWQDAAEFIALGATTIQVCTAVMHYGYRIVEDLIDGLNNYLNNKGLKSVSELTGQAIPGFVDWGELDLNYDIIAKIDGDKCIGCGLCYVACLDGAHQCIHTQKGPCHGWHGEADHGFGPRTEVMPPLHHDGGVPAMSHVPFVDEEECIGCNLCMLVCPVPDCITMVEASHSESKKSWKDHVAKGSA